MADTTPRLAVSKGIEFIHAAEVYGWTGAAERMGINAGESRYWQEWNRRNVCLPWVFRDSLEGIREIAGSDGCAPRLDELPLVVSEPRTVEFKGRAYPLDKDGLYRFVELTRSVRNLIVARQDGLLPVLQGLAGLQVHGNRDNHRTVPDLRDALPTCSYICITCGPMAALAAAVLHELGFATRPVNTLPAADWNTYDNGHVLFEVFGPRVGKWILADVDLGYLFKEGDTYLDAGEVWLCLREGRCPDLAPLAPGIVDPFFLSPTGFNWSLPLGWKLRDEDSRKAWYGRLMQVMAVRHEGKTFLVGDANRINAYYGTGTGEILPYAAWRRALYGP